MHTEGLQAVVRVLECLCDRQPGSAADPVIALRRQTIGSVRKNRWITQFTYGVNLTDDWKRPENQKSIQFTYGVNLTDDHSSRVDTRFKR
eukprot:60754-Chlamydomonas_euryale.AAC.4